jgi:CubicO group peptidase (beta-lactamase class C family)
MSHTASQNFVAYLKRKFLPSIALATLCPLLCLQSAFAGTPGPKAIDAEVQRAMAATQARGLAIAVIEQGQVRYVKSYGERNAVGQPLQRDSIMYGASLTKSAFAYMVMQLVQERRLDLDRPLAEYLKQPLPTYPTEEKYAPWADLALDPRWRKITARHVLTHSTGFANFAFVEADGKLRIHFDPGSHYAYSGEGFILLQFVIERGLGLDVGVEMQRRVFDRFKMPNTSMIWRPSFAANLADGWRVDGAIEPHDERSKVRAAGSMDTTIDDMARFAAGYIQGAGLSVNSRAALVQAQLPIKTISQFPSLPPQLAAQPRKDLAAGLGVIVFDGPQGAGFMKGGHNDSTGNLMVCVQRRRRCVVILANDVRAEPAFARLVEFILGATSAPLRWEYGDMVFWDGGLRVRK